MRAQADLLYILVACTILGITGFISLYLLGAIHSNAPQIFNSTVNPAGAQIYTAGLTGINYFNTLIVVIFIGAVLASGISASFVDTEPVFAFAGIIVLIVILLLTPVFHNLYFSFVQNSAFGGLAPPTDIVLFFEFLPLFALGGWFIIAYLTYGHGGGRGANYQQAYG